MRDPQPISPPRAEPPADLDRYWQRTLAEARAARRPTALERVDTGLSLVDTWDVTFSGFAGDRIRAWYHRPAGAAAALPIVVRYQGYGGGRGLPHELSPWPLAGYACLEVDTRGQGAQTGPRGTGDTPDPHGAGPAAAGFLTRGILDRDDYYYRRVYTDAAMAVDCAAELPGVRAGAIAVAGASQGGGVSLAVSGLAPSVTAVMADVPFLSDFRRGAALADGPPYAELAAYLAAYPDREARVFSTLAYFDVSILARRASAPALFSVALEDTVCPPQTVYAAYDAYAGPKRIHAYPFNEHEGGHVFHEAEQLRWLRDLVAFRRLDADPFGA